MNNGWQRSAGAWVADMGESGDFGRRYVLDPVMANIRTHPVPLLLMAVGIGWLVYKMVREQAEPALRNEDHGRGIQTPQKG